STRVIVDPAEVDVAASRSVRLLRSRPQPGVVVEALRHLGGFLAVAGLAVVGPTAGQTATDGVTITDAAIAHQFAGSAKVGVGTLLAAGLKDAFVFLDSVAHGPAFGDGQCQGFLTINVLAGLTGRDDGDGVPVIGRANDD